METIGIAIFLAVIIVVDYLVWTRGDSNRKLQHLEVLKRIKEIEGSSVFLSDNGAALKSLDSQKKG